MFLLLQRAIHPKAHKNAQPMEVVHTIPRGQVILKRLLRLKDTGACGILFSLHGPCIGFTTFVAELLYTRTIKNIYFMRRILSDS